MAALGISSTSEYEDYFGANPGEIEVLHDALRITISRFYRDRDVFDALRDKWLPVLLNEREGVRCWSIGCASGEEPYTLALIWHFHLQPRFPDRSFAVLGTDAGEHMLRRAEAGVYPAGALRELDSGWRDRAFAEEDGDFRLRDTYRDAVAFSGADMMDSLPQGMFDLVLCRNLAFMYFDERKASEALTRIERVLDARGLLVIGKHDTLPERNAPQWREVSRCIFRRASISGTLDRGEHA